MVARWLQGSATRWSHDTSRKNWTEPRGALEKCWFSTAFAQDVWVSDDFRGFWMALACFLLLHVKFSVAQDPPAFGGAQPGGA